MASQEDRERFSEPLKRRIGRACSDEALGANAIATALGRSLTTISPHLKALAEEKTLLVEEPEGGREQRLYRLDPAFAEALLEATNDAREVGMAIPGQQFLLVEDLDPNEVIAEFRPADIRGAIAWVARLAGTGMEYLIVFEREIDPFDVDTLRDRLQAAGGRCREATVREVIGAEAFLSRGRAMRSLRRARRRV